MSLVIRSVHENDLAELLRLNTAAVPAVNLVSEHELGALVSDADAVAVAEFEGRPVGFVLTLRPGLDYSSENYRFFEERGSDFLYVDRIVVADELRGAGIGRALYSAVFDRARAVGADEVCCEVNLEPPNPGSSRFHRSLGFAPVGSQATKGGDVTVELLAAPVTTS